MRLPLDLSTLETSSSLPVYDGSAMAIMLERHAEECLDERLSELFCILLGLKLHVCRFAFDLCFVYSLTTFGKPDLFDEKE